MKEHVEDGAGKDRSCNDGRVCCHWLRLRTPQSNAALKAEDQKNDPEAVLPGSPNGIPHLHTCQSRTCSKHFVMFSQQRRSPAHVWFVILPFLQHQMLPCCHFGRTTFARPVIRLGLGDHPLTQNRLAHPFPHSHD